MTAPTGRRGPAGRATDGATRKNTCRRGRSTGVRAGKAKARPILLRHLPALVKLDNGPHAPWRIDVRAWFAARPRRSHRARRPVPGVLEAHGRDPAAHPDAVVLVRQVAPRQRLRFPACGPAPPDDDLIGALIDAIALGGGRAVSEAEVRAAVARRGGRGRG